MRTKHPGSRAPARRPASSAPSFATQYTWHESTCSQPVECRDARLIGPSESPQELPRKRKGNDHEQSTADGNAHDGASYTSSAPLELPTGGFSGRPTHSDRYG